MTTRPNTTTQQSSYEQASSDSSKSSAEKPNSNYNSSPNLNEKDLERGFSADSNNDLEKAETVRPGYTDTQNGNANDLRHRVSRIRSMSGRQYQTFSHPLSHVKTHEEVLVDFDGPDDPYRPMNWPFRKKVVTTLLYGFTTMGITFASSVYSPAIPQVTKQFGVGSEVGLLGLSLLLLGFGFGPMLWAPLSEVYGRKSAVLIPYFFAAIFSFATGAAKDIQTVMISRFFAGFFGSAPITNTGGVLGDIWDPTTRGTAIVGYAMAVIGGPVLGPIVGSAIVVNTTWRWTEYSTGIFMLFVLVLDIMILDETYGPVLLVYKSRRLRHETGNWALHAKHEEWDVSITEMADKFLKRPLLMLITPICFCVALYASFVYGILYLNLAAFPISFQEERGWHPVVGSLPFLGLLLGIILGGGINVLNTKFYNKQFAANGNKPVPEARLPPMMIGSVFFAAGLFMFGWTSDKSIHWIIPVISTVFLGFGFFTIFQSALNYLIDTFLRYSASAIAANTFLRSVFASAFPLFASPMYHHLGIGWASSLLGFFAVALIPIPFFFYIYGPRLRKRGKYSADLSG